jgi:hypothetical protein
LSCLGMEPVSSLLNNQSRRRLDMSAIWVGIVPVIVALVKDNDAREVKRPISVGMVPVIELASSQIATKVDGDEKQVR